MNRKKRNIVIAAGSMIAVGIIIALLFIFSWPVFDSNTADNQNDQKKEEMLDMTLEWGRLASLPDSTEQFEISTAGNAFTRSFRSSFYVAKDDLEDWIKASPGLQDAEIKTTGDIKEYIIDLGGGANYAEAVIDFDKCFVKVYVAWS